MITSRYRARMDVLVRRPFLLSVITILMIISGAFSVIAGVVLAVFNNNDSLQRDSGESSSTLLTLGISGIVLGLIHIWLAVALRRGSRIARLLVGLYEFVVIAAAMWAPDRPPRPVPGERDHHDRHQPVRPVVPLRPSAVARLLRPLSAGNGLSARRLTC